MFTLTDGARVDPRAIVYVNTNGDCVELLLYGYPDMRLINCSSEAKAEQLAAALVVAKEGAE